MWPFKRKEEEFIKAVGDDIRVIQETEDDVDEE